MSTLRSKTADPHPKLPGTIHTAAEAIERAGGKAVPLTCDIRDPEAVAAAATRAIETLGGIDIVVNPEASGIEECRRRNEIQNGAPK